MAVAHRNGQQVAGKTRILCPSKKGSYEGLEILGECLRQDANTLRDLAAVLYAKRILDISTDLREAAELATRTADLTRKLREITEQALKQDPGVTARDIRRALDDFAAELAEGA